MFATERVAKNQEWFWPSDRLVAWLHALIDSGDARIECDDAESAHHLVSLMYHQRWQIAA
jgi:hypothetical protein